VPANQSTMSTNTTPQQSGLGQAIGYGIAGLGALAGVG
jgi:cyanate permease